MIVSGQMVGISCPVILEAGVPDKWVMEGQSLSSRGGVLCGPSLGLESFCPQVGSHHETQYVLHVCLLSSPRLCLFPEHGDPSCLFFLTLWSEPLDPHSAYSEGSVNAMRAYHVDG